MRKVEKTIQKTIIASSVVAALGVLAVPMVGVGAVDASDDTDVALTIDDVISIELGDGGTTTMSAEMEIVKTADLTTKVVANGRLGYVLTIEGSTADTNLNPVTGSSTPIYALTGTSQATGTTLTAGEGKWGIRGGDLGDTDNSWRGVPGNGSPLTLRDYTPAAPSTGVVTDTQTFTYGVAPSAAQDEDTYQNSFVYTATVKK